MSDLDELRAACAARGPDWLAALDRYGKEWSELRAVPAVLKIAQDAAGFDRILTGVAAVMARCHEARFEQQAVPVCGLEIALANRPAAMFAVVEGALALAELDVEPGWFVQLLVRPLARAAPGDTEFIAAWNGLVELACGIARDGQHPGYPIATGLAALVERGDLGALVRWREVLVPLAHAAKDSIYGLFEYGITGLAQQGLDASDVTDALALAIAMFDHGLQAGPTLHALATPLQLDLATKLAKAGIDPRLVITNGIACFEQLGLLDDGGERLERIALEVHRRGLRDLLFRDGLDLLPRLEFDYGGLGRRALDLIEAMISRDLEPAIIFRWNLPRVLGFIRPAWGAAELLGFAEALVEKGIAPEAAISYAARPLVELATDPEDFRRLAASVVALVAGMQALGVDHREVLFHDVAELAAAGQESQTFRELLVAVEKLLAAWTQTGLDPTELLKTALPAAAREAIGRPWVLATALRNATRIVQGPRPLDALTLLGVGVKTAIELGGGESDFGRTLGAIEQRYAALPAALASHASLAALVIAGTDETRLERALEIIAAASERHGSALLEIAPALPDLARMAGDQLATLIDALVALHSPSAIRIAAIAATPCRNDPAAAERAIGELGRWANAPDRAATLDRFGTLARVVTAPRLVACVEQVHAALAGLEERRVLLDLLEHARSEAVLLQMCTLVPALLRGGRGPLVDGLTRARELVARNPLAWTYLVAPALVTAKQHAGALLLTASLIQQRYVEREVDIEVIQHLITQRGVRAVDLIASLVIPALARRVMPSLGEHAELLERYLREVGFADADVYGHFVEIVRDDDEATKPARIAALREEIAGLTTGIRAGEVTEAQRAHALFGVALQHVFPGSITATRDLWLRLVDAMPDRPGDVTALWPGGHDAPLEVAAGSWQLVEGEHDLSAFAWCGRVLPGELAPRPIAELGWELVTLWSEGRLAREPHKTELARALLAHAPAEALPNATYDSASQLLAIRALAADRTSGLVELAVLAARAQDPDRVDRLVQTRLAPVPRIGPALVKSLAKTLDAVRAGTLDREAAEKRLRGQLAMFELPALDALLGSIDLASTLHSLTPRAVAIEPGKELGRIHADLVGQELAAMTAAIASALEYRASSSVVAIDCTITKRSLHAPIGLTAGVCVATDLELWSSPHFMHLALWQGGVCMGNVHLLVVTEGGERYLALPGINPSFALLERVEAEVVLRVLLDRIRALAREAGLAGVWIPTSPQIHSNRRAIHDALAALNLPERRTAGHAFSYKPYAYRIDAVWQLD